MTDPPIPAILRDFPDRFEAERLTVRAPRPGDGPAVHRAVTESLEELTPWMPWANGEYTEVVAETYVRQGSADFAARRDLPLLLFLRDTDELVGSSGLHPIQWAVPSFEIGYWVRSGMTGRGFATEAVRRIADFAFDVLGAVRLEIWCDARNDRSAAVARRAGFTLEAQMRRNRRDTAGNLSDSMCFTRLRPATLDRSVADG